MRRTRRRRLRIALLCLAAVTGVCMYFFVGGGGSASAGASTGGSSYITTLTETASSMEPTIHCARPQLGCQGASADRVELKTPSTHLQRGDIVAFTGLARASAGCGAAGHTFLKRIVALPGETVSYNGRDLTVNGKPVREPYVASSGQGGPTGNWRVPMGTMGDNRPQSCDSRRWGGVPRKDIEGTVAKIVRPGG